MSILTDSIMIIETSSTMFVFFIALYILISTASGEHCPDGYTEMGNMCILLGKAAPWQIAQKACDDAGATMFLIKDKTQWDILKVAGPEKELTTIWVGLHYDQSTSTFQWSDGTAYDPKTDWAPWADGQPKLETGQCVVIKNYNKVLAWVMTSCNAPMVGLCVKAMPTTPGTGTPFTMPTFLPISCPPGMFGFGGHCMKYNKEMVTYDVASKSCEESNSYILFTREKKLWDYATYYMGSQMPNFWVGLFYNKSINKLQWSDGKPYDPEKDFAPWAPNQPGNPGEWAGDCVNVQQDFDSGQYLWLMATCEQALYGVCILEMPITSTIAVTTPTSTVTTTRTTSSTTTTAPATTTTTSTSTTTTSTSAVTTSTATTTSSSTVTSTTSSPPTMSSIPVTTSVLSTSQVSFSDNVNHSSVGSLLLPGPATTSPVAASPAATSPAAASPTAASTSSAGMPATETRLENASHQTTSMNTGSIPSTASNVVDNKAIAQASGTVGTTADHSLNSTSILMESGAPAAVSLSSMNSSRWSSGTLAPGSTLNVCPGSQCAQSRRSNVSRSGAAITQSGSSTSSNLTFTSLPVPSSSAQSVSVSVQSSSSPSTASSSKSIAFSASISKPVSTANPIKLTSAGSGTVSTASPSTKETAKSLVVPSLPLAKPISHALSTPEDRDVTAVPLVNQPRGVPMHDSGKTVAPDPPKWPWYIPFSIGSGCLVVFCVLLAICACVCNCKKDKPRPGVYPYYP